MSKYSIETKLNSYYSQKRFDSQKDYEERLHEAMQNKEFKDLFITHRQLSLKKLSGDTKAIEKDTIVSSKLLDLIQKEKYDLNKYCACAKCKDTGLVDGKPCECRINLRKSLLKQESNLPKFATATFEDNKFAKINAKQAKKMNGVYADCKRWAENLDKAQKRVVFLMGSVGVGKTTLAFSVANKAIDNGNAVYYTTAYDLSTMLIDNQFNRLQNPEKYENMLDSDLLIIDDLGSEPQNVLAIENLFAILDSRINKNAKTMICTNLTLEQFSKRYGERSLSRLTSIAFAYVPSFISGDDLRKIKC